mgnify:CR=1 FL=1
MAHRSRCEAEPQAGAETILVAEDEPEVRRFTQHALERLGEAEGNELSVRLELQADCYAGVWANNAHRARQILEEGDIEEALRAANAIGDDRLQRQSRGYITPDSFTHGTSAQRVRWFKTGLQEGTLSACNTFAADTI